MSDDQNNVLDFPKYSNVQGKNDILRMAKVELRRLGVSDENIIPALKEIEPVINKFLIETKVPIPAWPEGSELTPELMGEIDSVYKQCMTYLLQDNSHRLTGLFRALVDVVAEKYAHQ